MVKKWLKYLLVLFKGLLSFLIFAISSQFFTLLILIPFTNKKNSAKTLYTRLLTFYARFIIKTHFNIKVKHVNFRKKMFDSPVLVVCNHQSVIDAPISLAFSTKMRVINNNWHNNKWAGFFITKYIGFFSIYQNLDLLAEKLKPSIGMGCPLLIFPEGVMNYNQKIIRFHKGGFYIAKKLNIDIQPVVIYYSENVLKKNWFFLKNGFVIVKYLDRIKVDSPMYGESYQKLTNNVIEVMRREYDIIKKQSQC